jgi:hypothetical protein
MYHSVPTLQSDAIVMSFHGKISPEGTTHAVDDGCFKLIGLSVAREAEVTIDDLLDMFQHRQVGNAVRINAVEIFTEPVAFLGHA